MELLRTISRSFSEWLVDQGLNEELSIILSDYVWLIGVALLAWIAYYFVKKVLYNFLQGLVKRSSNQIDDILLEQKLFRRVSYYAPALVIYKIAPWVISGYVGMAFFITRVMEAYMLMVTILVIESFFNSIHHVYSTTEMSKSRPIKGFIQVAKIFVYAIGFVILLSWLLGQKPLALLGGLGALSAVLMLVFKDSILGFVAGIQLSANQMVQIGDWISMPKYDVDGSVIDISLTTVKIQNWDNTISMVPTYNLISDSVKNYRGMQESGARRIARSINLNMNSVKFCTPEMLERFERIHYIEDYVRRKEDELNSYNSTNNIDSSIVVNGRRQTNIGVFRVYVSEYIKNHPRIRKDLTILVRQMPLSELGLPIQIYCFTDTTVWIEYEQIQSDIFDHLLAILPYFDLQVFQNASGSDFNKLSQSTRN
jgi:miniconductance mechanosensitive channel